MKHLIKYRLISLLRNKELVFWTLLFPLLLSTLFHFAFSNLGDTLLEPVPVAVVDNAAYQNDMALRQTLEALSKPGENQLLRLTVTDEATAKQMLKDQKIDGFLTSGETLGLTVAKSGINQSILKSFLDEYQKVNLTLRRILAEHPDKAGEVIQSVSEQVSYTRDASLSKAKPDTKLNYFYTVIAMTCLYGGFWGIENALSLKPNLSDLGARRSVAPTNKFKVILSEQLVTIALQFAIILVVLAYLAGVLRVDFGRQWGYVLLSCFTGCMFGVSMGTFIGAGKGRKPGVKVATLLVISMLGSFLAGMMVNNMKDIIAHKAPFINYINPAALLTDSFYSLYYFDTHDRFFLNILILWGMTAVLWAGSFLKLRRQKYAAL